MARIQDSALREHERGNAGKHLIWFGSDGEWHYPTKTYGSVEEAWDAVRSGFVELLGLASEGRFDEVDGVEALSGAVASRSKTLFMYFPDDVLPISSKAHVDYFLQALGDPASNWSAVRRRIVTFLTCSALNRASQG